MLDNQLIDEVAVDRREEIVKIQQPGYTSTQQVTRDVAGEQRLRLFQITRIMWMVLGVLEIMLGLRFILKLMAANPSNGFAGLVYGITGTFTGPFDALLGTPAIDGSIFEATTLIAMSVYAILFGFAARLILLIADRPRVRTAVRSVLEQPPSNVADASLDRIERMDQPEVVGIVKLPIEVNSPEEDLLIRAYIDPMNQPQIISIVKIPIKVNPPREDPLLRAYAEFLRRYRRAITIAEPVITLNGVELETQTADVGL